MTAASRAVPALDVAALQRDLVQYVDGEVCFDAGSRGAYAMDASNYRQVPIGVVIPRDSDAAVATVGVCREHGAPVLSRGGGTSLAGQCCNTAVVIDWSKYCHNVVEIDAERRRVVVEPGAVLDQVNAALAPHRLMIGPRPSTHAACTIGGMIGNNSCGATAQAYGKMADAVERLDIVTYEGLRTWVGQTSDDEYQRIVGAGDRRAGIFRQLRQLRDDSMALIRTRYPDIPRRVSGYNLDQLLPEHGFHVARALVGSEGTLVTVVRAELNLVDVPRFCGLVVLGYPDIATAADAVPTVVSHQPLACEGMDDRLIALAREKHLGADAVKELPEGPSWLMVQFGGETRQEVRERAEAMLAELAGRDGASPRSAYVDDAGTEEELWKLREASLGLSAYPEGGRETHEGWEDAAVPPDRLGDYLRDFRRLLNSYDYAEESVLYGHFGHGCVHTRIPFDLLSQAGVRRFRSFVEEAADLVVSYGGSFSGEHGDGQARGELLPKMFGDEVVQAFRRLKAIFDPQDRMNPGKLVRPDDGRPPYRFDDNLALLDWPTSRPTTYFDYPADHGEFWHAAARCVGVGKCRSASGGVMCPSYRVTRDEKHTTRGRARLLAEMIRGDVVAAGWHSDAVHEALDLCLACKGCRKDCPVSVDMATYKAEFLAHYYAGMLRPRAHYSMGWLPVWARVAAIAPRTVNAITHAPGLASLLKLAAGVAGERELPRFAGQRFTDWYRRRDGQRAGGPRGAVVLWPDTFTNNFDPQIAHAAVRVLEGIGFTVDVPAGSLCCGLPWISTGQLKRAKRVLNRALAALAPLVRAGLPVVVLEPSCAAVFRADAVELLGTDTAQLVADHTVTVAELIGDRAADWPATPAAAGGQQPPARVPSETSPLPAMTPTLPMKVTAATAQESPAATRAIAQVHCHQHAIMGFDPDRELLGRLGVELEVLDSGCCGLAGNFGFERGHYEVSVACAEQGGLWPAVRAAPADSVLLADGFSCRTQIAAAGAGRRAVHLVELLDSLAEAVSHSGEPR